MGCRSIDSACSPWYRVARLPAGLYNVIFDSTHKKELTAVAREAVKVEAGQTVSGQDFELIEGTLITGTVRNAAGKPVANVNLGVYGPAHPESSAWVQSGRTDVNGKYTLRVPPGMQYVYVMGSDPQQSKRVETKVGRPTVVDFRVG